jgi:hypothetical protein
VPAVESGLKMKKEHSVFITLDNDEIAALIHPVLKRKGLLENVPNNIAPEVFQYGEQSFEYKWEEEIN